LNRSSVQEGPGALQEAGLHDNPGLRLGAVHAKGLQPCPAGGTAVPISPGLVIALALENTRIAVSDPRRRENSFVPFLLRFVSATEQIVETRGDSIAAC
jgi:hypothetical protein